MIIGVCGLIGAGKDTVADYLVNIHEFRRDSFAGSLKDAISTIFGWDRELLEGRSKHSREWREQPDEWWSNRLGKTITPRAVLQLWGTEVCRNGYHEDIWVASLENKVRNTKDDIVISDCRFPNEINAIRNNGGYVIRVVRGPDPEWYEYASNVNQGQTNLMWSISNMNLKKFDIHVSESAWAGTKFDAILDNNGTLDQLYQQINDLVQDLRLSKANQAA